MQHGGLLSKQEGQWSDKVRGSMRLRSQVEVDAGKERFTRETVIVAR